MGRKKLLECVNLSGEAVKPFIGEKYYLSTGALKRDTIEYAELELVTYNNKPSRASTVVKSGDIAFAKMARTCKTYIFDEKSKNIIISSGFFVIRAKPNVDSNFMYCFLCLMISIYKKTAYRLGQLRKH